MAAVDDDQALAPVGGPGIGTPIVGGRAQPGRPPDEQGRRYRFRVDPALSGSAAALSLGASSATRDGSAWPDALVSSGGSSR